MLLDLYQSENIDLEISLTNFILNLVAVWALMIFFFFFRDNANLQYKMYKPQHWGCMDQIKDKEQEQISRMHHIGTKCAAQRHFNFAAVTEKIFFFF